MSIWSSQSNDLKDSKSKLEKTRFDRNCFIGLAAFFCYFSIHAHLFSSRKSFEVFITHSEFFKDWLNSKVMGNSLSIGYAAIGLLCMLFAGFEHARLLRSRSEKQA